MNFIAVGKVIIEMAIFKRSSDFKLFVLIRIIVKIIMAQIIIDFNCHNY